MDGLIFLLLILHAFLSNQTSVQERPSSIPEPIFFLSLTSECRFGNASMNPDSSFAVRGSLCAYAEQPNIVYSCPAGDPYCWNQGGECSGDDNLTAGSEEVLCSDIGSGLIYWCCNSQFGNCTQTEFQQDNCWSWFDNPNRDVNSLAASSSASVAMQGAISQPTLTNIIVSTVKAGGWRPVQITTTPIISSAAIWSSLASGVSFGTSTVTASGLDEATNPPTIHSDSRSTPAGVLVGIAVGAAVAASTLATMVFMILLHRQRSKTAKSAQGGGLQSTSYVSPIFGSSRSSEVPAPQKALLHGEVELAASPAAGIQLKTHVQPVELSSDHRLTIKQL